MSAEKKQEFLIQIIPLFLKYGFRSMGVDDISKELGISKSTLHRWMNKEGLKYYKVSRRVFFKTNDFNEWIEKYRMEK